MNIFKTILIQFILIYSFSVYSQNVKYDNQDNVIFFQNSWLQNWDFQNDNVANQDIALIKDSDNSLFKLVSTNYRLLDVHFINSYSDVDIEYNYNYSVVTIYYDDLDIHCGNDDFFLFNVKYDKRKLKCDCIKFYAIDYWNGIITVPDSLYIEIQNLDNNTFELYEYVPQGTCIPLFPEIKYKINTAVDEDNFIHSTIYLNQYNWDKNIKKCTLKTKMLHYE